MPTNKVSKSSKAMANKKNKVTTQYILTGADQKPFRGMRKTIKQQMRLIAHFIVSLRSNLTNKDMKSLPFLRNKFDKFQIKI